MQKMSGKDGVPAADVNPEERSQPTEAETATAAMEARPSLLFLRESTDWWTPMALAWGTPVKMWATMVASACRPFLPPTALTATARPLPTAPAGASRPPEVSPPQLEDTGAGTGPRQRRRR